MVYFKTFLKSKSGFSLVELILVLSLIGLVLAGIYSYFFFSHRSWVVADASAIVNHDVRNFMMQVERDIHSAVSFEILDEGKRLRVFTFYGESIPIDGDTSSQGKYVTYLFDNENMIVRAENELQDTPDSDLDWFIVINNVIQKKDNGDILPLFNDDDKKVLLNFLVADPDDLVFVNVNNTITIRSE